MKKLKMICTAAMLALVLSLPGYAGEITTPGFTGEILTPGLTQPAPTAEDLSRNSASKEPGDLSTPELTAILLTIAALF